MLESKELELQSRLTLGTLESNAEAIRQIVLKHLEEYALVFTLTRSQFLDLRGYMSDHGITYSELQDKGSGVYTK
nr:MAG TPA: hypothetical protein [Caudoviricetes sp.]